MADTDRQDEVRSNWRDCRQGDVIPLDSLPIIVESRVVPSPTPHGVTLISQTCDIVLDKHPNVVIAAVVELAKQDADEARDGARPRYVSLPGYGTNKFVDLEFVATVRKTDVSMDGIVPGLIQKNDNQVRVFALRVARRFGRFAFPDDVVPWLLPLQKTVREKYDRPKSAIGLALQEVVELRVEAINWQRRPLDLTLHVIVRAGTLPELSEDEQIEIPELLREWLRPDGVLLRNPTHIAERIYGAHLNQRPMPTAVEKYHLWLAFGEALGDLCKPKNSPEPAHASVNSVKGLLSTDDEFSLAQQRKSEMLDLDHLSEPTPFGDATSAAPTP